MGKLSEDVIAATIAINTAEAQTEIHTLVERNKELKKESQEVAKELKKLEKNGEQGSEKYKELSAAVRENNKQMADNKEKIASLTDSIDKQGLSMNQMRNRARELKAELDGMNRVQNPEKFDALTKKLGEYQNAMKGASSGGRKLSDELSSLPGPAGAAVQSVKGVAQAMKLLIANPVGVVIMAAVLAFQALKLAIKGSDDGSTKFAATLSFFGNIVKTCLRILTEFFVMLKNIATLNFEGVRENAQAIKELTTSMVDNATAAYEATVQMDAYNDVINRNNDLILINDARINELRETVTDTSKTIEERQKASEEVLARQEDSFKRRVANATMEMDNFMLQEKNLMDAIRRHDKTKYNEMLKYIELVKSGKEITIAQREAMANLMNDITTGLDRADEETKTRLRGIFNQYNEINAQYFSARRKDIKASVALEKEQQAERERKAQEAASKAKELIQKRYEAEALALEKLILEEKKRYEAGEMSLQEYNDKVVELTRRSVEKQLSIKGLEEKTRLSLLGKLADMDIKAKDEENNRLKAQDAQRLQLLKKSYEEEAKNLQRHNEDLSLLLQQRLRDGLISQEQHDNEARLLALNLADALRKLWLDYDQDLHDLEVSHYLSKVELVEESEEKIRQLTRASMDKQAEIYQQAISAVAEFRRQNALMTTEEEHDLMVKGIEATYRARLALLKQSGASEEEILRLQQAKEEAIRRAKEDKDIYRLRAKQALGTATLWEQATLEMQMLEQMHRDGLISEEEYQLARKKIIVRTYTDAMNQVAALASSAMQAMQDAEMASIENRYSAEVAAAEGNSDKLAEIENRKEAEKMDIQKKYADVQFAVKIAEIISNTAVSIMQGYAQLGPVAGSVAAVMLGVTGAAQLATAKAERDRVKNLRPDGSSGGGISTRVAIGREEGGHIDVERAQDGKRFRAAFSPLKRGYVDRPTVIVGEGAPGSSREWVASNAALKNPTIAPVIDLLNHAQSAGTIRYIDFNQLYHARVLGRESGGFVTSEKGTAPTYLTTPKVNDPLIEKLTRAIDRLNAEGVKAAVVYNELERKQNLLHRSREAARL
ncbi:MAG: SHOCT domain-containing protein [Porphyromonas sp.]|nr:SHOCT domain-containing protein [Porphyromonas sp.]